MISISEGDIEDLHIPDRVSVVLSNPPWGLRLADEDGEAWKKLGLFLKQNARGGDAYLICGNGEVRIPLQTGFTPSSINYRPSRTPVPHRLSLAHSLACSQATKELRMRADSKRPVRLGNVDCRLLKYHVLKAKDSAR